MPGFVLNFGANRFLMRKKPSALRYLLFGAKPDADVLHVIEFTTEVVESLEVVGRDFNRTRCQRQSNRAVDEREGQVALTENWSELCSAH